MNLALVVGVAGCVGEPQKMSTAPPAAAPDGASRANEMLVIEIEMKAARERVWNAWTDPAILKNWLTEDANVRLEAGGAYELFWEPDHKERNSTVGCAFTEIKPQEVLAFSWKGPVSYADLMNKEPLPTSVKVTFVAVDPNRTKVRLEHKGWGDGPRWSEARTWQEHAWRSALDELRKLLE